MSICVWPSARSRAARICLSLRGFWFDGRGGIVGHEVFRLSLRLDPGRRRRLGVKTSCSNLALPDAPLALLAVRGDGDASTLSSTSSWSASRGRTFDAVVVVTRAVVVLAQGCIHVYMCTYCMYARTFSTYTWHVTYATKAWNLSVSGLDEETLATSSSSVPSWMVSSFRRLVVGRVRRGIDVLVLAKKERVRA